MLKIDLHVHTVKSGCGFATLYEIAHQARLNKMHIIAITDHGPSVPASGVGEHFSLQFRAPAEIEGVTVLFGAEVNILDTKGKLDLNEKVIATLRPVIAGFHSIAGYKDLGEKGNTEAILNAIANPHVHIISHPIRLRYPVDVDAIAVAACTHGKLLELNAVMFTHMKKLSVNDLKLYRRMIEVVRSRGHKVIVNSDAHFLHELGDDSAVRKFQKELGLRDEDIINNYPDELMKLLRIE